MLIHLSDTAIDLKNILRYRSGETIV